MQKETKNILTKEIIAGDMRTEDKKNKPALLCFSFVYTAILGIIFSLIYFVGLKNVDIGPVGHVVFFAFVLICCFPLFFALFTALSPARGHKGFFVVTDEVVYKEDMPFNRPGKKRSYRKFVHFAKFGDVEVSSTLFQLASKGDVYYMVVPERDSNHVLKCYPAKMYEYKE